jgi:hypothetical protein
VRREQSGDEARLGGAEEQVRQRLCMRVPDPAAGFARLRQAADLAQRTADAVRIAGELDAARIGEVLALARHGGLDQATEEDADVTDDPQRDPGDGQHRQSAAAVAAAAADLEHEAAEHRQHQQAEQHADQADVQAHVAVEDMAELVPDHALQLVAGQPRQRAAGDCDHRIVQRVAGGKGIDRHLVVHHVHARHRRAGGERHLLDHVDQPSLEQVARRRIDAPGADHLRHGLAAAGQPRRFPPGPGADHQHGDQGVGQVEAARQRRREDTEVEDGGDDVDRDHDPDHRQHEQNHQAPAHPARGFLVLEEVHRGSLDGSFSSDCGRRTGVAPRPRLRRARAQPASPKAAAASTLRTAP